MSQAFTTRAEAAAPAAFLVRLMASAAYERGSSGSSRPPFDQTEQAWQEAACREMAAAILAAEAAGYVITERRHGS
jgi:hypothetical protein